MSDRHEPLQENELNRLWNDLVSGNGSEGEYDLPAGDAELLSQFQHRVTRSQPDSARERAWRRTLAQIEPDQSQQGEKESKMHAIARNPPGGYRHSPNGRAAPRRLGGFAPEIGRALTARRWNIAQLIAAAMLLVSLGIGYVVYGPGLGGDDGPSSIPAAVAPAAAPGTPAPTATVATYPRAGHPIIGAWLIDYAPETPGRNTNYIVFHDDGTVTEYESFSGASIGVWRATGPSTVEFVAINQHHIALDFMFEPDYDVVEPVLDGSVVTSWRTLELDATGNAFTANGYYEPRNADGSVITRLDFRGPESPLLGQRLAPVSDEAPATPTP